MILLLLLLLPTAAVSKGEECTARCDRLHTRSIGRKGVDKATIEHILEKQKPVSMLKDVCWRLYDRLDCLKNCPKEKELNKYARDVRFKCKGVLGALASELKCVSKYRSFMQVKCSTFLKEAVSLRVTQEKDSVPDRETCRYLHLNSLCLENTVGTYCPSAGRIFRRLNFRDYFLNFIVPENDLLFDDVDLDNCQIYDFVKIAKGASEEADELTTIINKWEEQSTRPMTTKRTSTTSTHAQDREKFTTLLNELLESSENTVLTSTELYETTSGELSELLEEETVTEQTEKSELLGEEETITMRDQILSKLDGRVTEMDEIPALLNGQGTIVHLDEDTFEKYTTYKVETEASMSPNYTKKTILEENRIKGEKTTTLSPSSTTFLSSTEYDDSTIIIPSSLRNIFSDDSMENIPPNFFWSSARYRSSTLSASNGRHLSSMEIVRPVEVDTTTLLGDDFPQGPIKVEPAWTTPAPELSLLPPKIVVKSAVLSTTPRSTIRIAVSFSPKAEARAEVHTRAEPSTSTTDMTKTVTPLLNGEVVVKTIKRWGEPESDEEGRESEKIQRSPVLNEEELDRRLSSSREYDEEVTQQGTTDRLSDKEILLFIYIILFALALLSLICILLFCVCCKRKPSASSGNKY